jgi:hypothetical protein
MPHQQQRFLNAIAVESFAAGAIQISWDARFGVFRGCFSCWAQMLSKAVLQGMVQGQGESMLHVLVLHNSCLCSFYILGHSRAVVVV